MAAHDAPCWPDWWTDETTTDQDSVVHSLWSWTVPQRGQDAVKTTSVLLLALGRRGSRPGSRPGGGAVGGGQQHGEEDQHRDQQVGGVYGDQHPALLQSLWTGVWRGGELMEEDVGQDRDQGGGHVCGVDDGRSPDPPAAT